MDVTEVTNCVGEQQRVAFTTADVHSFFVELQGLITATHVSLDLAPPPE